MDTANWRVPGRSLADMQAAFEMVLSVITDGGRSNVNIHARQHANPIMSCSACGTTPADIIRKEQPTHHRQTPSWRHGVIPHHSGVEIRWRGGCCVQPCDDIYDHMIILYRYTSLRTYTRRRSVITCTTWCIRRRYIDLHIH